MPSPSPSPPAPGDLPPGFSFNPAGEDLIGRYLRCKISGSPLPAFIAGFFHDADVYAADPAMLTTKFPPALARTGGIKYWFFFTSVLAKSSKDNRRSRVVGHGKGTWKAEERKDVFDEDGRRVGYQRNFSYKPKNGGNNSKMLTEWLMVEFGVDEDDQEGRRHGESVTVLCKIYQSPRFLSSARKRKAADERRDLAPSSRVKRKLFLSPAAAQALPAEEPTYEFLDYFLMPNPEPGDKSTLNPISFVDNQTNSAPMSCYDGTLLGDGGGNWGVPPGETSTLNPSFFVDNQTNSALMSCYDLGDGGGSWGVPPCSSDAQTSASWTAPFMTGMELLAGLPTGEELWTMAGSGQDASYWCSEPASGCGSSTASALASASASTLLCTGYNAIAAPWVTSLRC